MLDWRIYRAALIPCVLVALVTAFSLRDGPPGATSTLAPDAFDGKAAFALLGDLAARYPQRRPGSPADQALAGQAAAAFRRAGFEVQVSNRSVQTIAGPRTIQTVLAQRAGTDPGQIVLLAHRDSAGRGAAAELSGTAALLELAHVFSGRVTSHSLALVSTSGGSGGDAGAADFAAHPRGPVDAALALGDLATPHGPGPLVVPWSDGRGEAPLRLRRTLDWALGLEVGRPGGAPGAAVTLARLAVPLTLSEQGPLLAQGQAAVTLSATGERAPTSDAPVDQPTLQNYGRAVLRAVNALDSGVPPGAPETSLELGRKVLPAWAVRLLVGTLLLAPLLVTVDGLARARRRKTPTLAGLVWALTDTLPFLVTAAYVIGAGRAGLLGPVPRAPVLPRAVPVDGLALASAALVFALCWLARPLLLARVGVPDAAATARSPATGPVVMLGMCLLALIVWVGNPYAALLVIPALHIWLIPIAPELRVRRWLAVALVLLGALPLAAVVVIYLAQLGVTPLQGAWMAELLVGGGHVGPLGALVWSLLLGCGLSLLAISVRRARTSAEPPAPVTVRGPLGYAGPGSLGGTESALRR